MTDAQKLEDVKKNLPPYLSVAKLRSLTEKITHTTPRTITPASLKGEYGATDASIAMGVLRFLGVVDESDNVTDVIKKFQQRDTELRTKELAEVVKDVYSELFSYVVNGTPHLMPPAKLEGAIQNVYGVAPRIAEPAARAFVFLCEESGLKDHSVSAPRVQTPRTKKTESPRKANTTSDSGKQAATSFGADTTAIPFEGGIVFVLPTKVLSNAELITDYKNVLTAIKTFVTKCIPFLKEGPIDND